MRSAFKSQLQHRNKSSRPKARTYRSLTCTNKDTCISKGLTHVGAWYRGTGGSKLHVTKFGKYASIGQTITLLNLVALPQEVCEISAYENLGSQKTGPTFTKIENAPHRAKIIASRSVKRCTRKAFQFFYTLQYFDNLYSPVSE